MMSRVTTSQALLVLDATYSVADVPRVAVMNTSVSRAETDEPIEIPVGRGLT